MKQAKLASEIYQTSQKVSKKRKIFAQTAVVFKYMPGRRKAGGRLETDGRSSRGDAPYPETPKCLKSIQATLREHL